MFKVALFHNNKNEEWINKHKEFIYDWYSDKDSIAVYVIPANESCCGQRYNAVFFDEEIYPSERDAIVLPAANLAPGDVYVILDKPRNVTLYELVQGYRRDNTSPEERVAAWVEEVGL